MMTTDKQFKWRLSDRWPTAVVTDDLDKELYHCSHREVEDYGGALVCESIASPKVATLIAAAPALLEACKHAVEVLDWCGPQRGYTGKQHQEMYAEVRAAIAQAEGRAQ